MTCVITMNFQSGSSPRPLKLSHSLVLELKSKELKNQPIAIKYGNSLIPLWRTLSIEVYLLKMDTKTDLVGFLPYGT